MAAKQRPQHHADTQLESPMDYAEHERTYSGFVTGIKWTIIVAAVSMVILYFFVQP